MSQSSLKSTSALWILYSCTHTNTLRSSSLRTCPEGRNENACVKPFYVLPLTTTSSTYTTF